MLFSVTLLVNDLCDFQNGDKAKSIETTCTVRNAKNKDVIVNGE